MLIFYSPDTQKRRARIELHNGEIVAPFECPERVDMIIEQLRGQGLGEIRAPAAHGLAPVRRVHDADYVEFIEHAWEQWQAAGLAGEAMATTWPTRNTHRLRIPSDIDGRVGYYALAAETTIESGTFAAAQASADVAVSALDHVRATGEPAFGLCRPPGHHAASDQFGGYCFFNNAGIAAQRALDDGAERVTILDVDYHHGNGTQQIFYDRDDVQFVSLHADPALAFPYFSGYADETGEGLGEGFTCNYPLHHGTDYATWVAALDDALGEIERYAPDLLIVSLGVDTFKDDPISQFTLDSADFHDYGQRIAALGLPTLIVMEGGYAVEAIGVNVGQMLAGFESA